MRIKKIEHESLSTKETVYDVVDVKPYHNFELGTLTDNRKIFSHNSVLERMRSRFMIEGKVAGCLFMVSSKKSESDFIESYIQKQKNNPDVYVCDARLWDVKPSGTYSGKMFLVAVGGSNMQSRIIEEGEDIDFYKKQGYDILEVPIEFKSGFEMDIQAALMNVAGISVSYVTKFITYDALSKCYGEHNVNPFTQEVLTIGMYDSYTIQEYFLPDVIPEDIYSKPLFVHIDTSLKGDRTGIGCVAAMGYRYASRYNLTKGGMETTKEIVYHQVFSVGIQCPKGSEISFQKTREFIYYLKNTLGWNIKAITLDGFQSFDSRQQFETMGFKDSKILSLDKTPDGYMMLKSAIYERRISLLNLSVLEQEIIQLERNNMSGKIDHPVDGCFTGDTKIRLVDGRTLTILELMNEQKYKTNWVYTVNEQTKKIEPKRIKKVFQTKITSDLVKVTLDNGESVMCTPEHRFMLRDGSYEEAQNLHCGDSLMPLYTKISNDGLNGYRMYYEPTCDKWHYEHRKFSNTVIKKGNIIHHCNYNKLDNCPTNLKQMTKSEHIKLHNNLTHDYNKVSESLKKWYNDIQGTDIAINRCENCRKATIQSLKKSGKYKNLKQIRIDKIRNIEKHYNIVWDNLTSIEKNHYSVMYAHYNDSSIKQHISDKVKQNHKNGVYNNAKIALSNRVWYTNGVDNLYIKEYEVPPDGYCKGRTISKESIEKMKQTVRNKSDVDKRRISIKHSIDTSNRMWITDGEQDRYIQRDEVIPDGFVKGRSKVGKNHKVVSIEWVHCPCRVYDLTIEDNPNFALDIGVFVHNSKDCSDALAGALYNASLHKDDFGFDLADDNSLLLDVNDDVDVDSDKSKLLKSIVNIQPTSDSTDTNNVELKDAFHDYINSMIKGDSAVVIDERAEAEIQKQEQEQKQKQIELNTNRQNYLKAKQNQQYGVSVEIDNYDSMFNDVEDGILIF